jgi:hypothetical protein
MQLNFSVGDIVRCDNLFGFVVHIDENKFKIHWFDDDAPMPYNRKYDWESIVRA